MFKKILAIDLDSMKGQLEKRVLGFSKNSITFIASPKDVVTLNNEADDIEAIVVSIQQSLDEKELSRFKNLRYVGVMGTSLKRIATNYLDEKKIAYKAVAEYCDYETAEWVFWQMLNHVRQQKPAQSLKNMTIGLVGVGAVGNALATLVLSTPAKLIFNATSEHKQLQKCGAIKCSKEEVFAKANIISLHTPAHLSWLLESHLRLCRRDALVINTVLGLVGQESAIISALQERRDITFLCDAIAKNYFNDKSLIKVSQDFAFKTQSSLQSLHEQFLKNLRDSQ